MSIINPPLNKYDMFFCIYLDLPPLNLAYFVLENGNYVLENYISLAVGTMDKTHGVFLWFID